MKDQTFKKRIFLIKIRVYLKKKKRKKQNAIYKKMLIPFKECQMDY